MTKSHLSTRYPGGFRLTMKTAKELARQEFGTAAGLMRDPGTNLDGYFVMNLGNLAITIRPDIRMSGCIEVRAGMHTANHSCVGYFDPATLEPRYGDGDPDDGEWAVAIDGWLYDIATLDGADFAETVMEEFSHIAETLDHPSGKYTVHYGPPHRQTADQRG